MLFLVLLTQIFVIALALYLQHEARYPFGRGSVFGLGILFDSE